MDEENRHVENVEAPAPKRARKLIHVCPHEDCGKSFSTTTRLAEHRRTHTGERPFTCSFHGCGKAFSCGSHLTRHERLHTGERPFVCSVPGCGRAFAQSGGLIIHERVHTGERPFVCQFKDCNKAFTDKATRARHERRHKDGGDRVTSPLPPPSSPPSMLGDDSSGEITPRPEEPSTPRAGSRPGFGTSSLFASTVIGASHRPASPAKMSLKFSIGLAADSSNQIAFSLMEPPYPCSCPGCLSPALPGVSRASHQRMSCVHQQKRGVAPPATPADESQMDAALALWNLAGMSAA